MPRPTNGAPGASTPLYRVGEGSPSERLFYCEVESGREVCHRSDFLTGDWLPFSFGIHRKEGLQTAAPCSSVPAPRHNDVAAICLMLQRVAGSSHSKFPNSDLPFLKLFSAKKKVFGGALINFWRLLWSYVSVVLGAWTLFAKGNFISPVAEKVGKLHGIVSLIV